MGILEAIWRFITFANWRQGDKIRKAADKQFTGSVEGVGAAFELEMEQKRKDANEVIAAVSQVETVINQNRTFLKKVQDEVTKLTKARDGAIKVAMDAQSKGDTTKFEEAKAAGQRFITDLEKASARQTKLITDIKAQEERLVPLKTTLSNMIEELRNLPAKKAEAMERFVASKALKDANQKILNLQQRSQESPLDAVEQALNQMEGEANVTSDLAGITTTNKTDEYVQAGESEAATSDFDRMLAAKKAEHDAATGNAPISNPVTEKRPEL